ncbi:MAG: hypothetical protein B0D96_08850 [Candidatus Sedimenticola endophacoides]|uniref:Uncharacterized protein n=1 Tax=Candidatus Sedimenticola endophacoides TaxID=2548426 RepID=A0A657PS52_9GAMM|nr:MAG: hypothetical protein B0D94_12095 [Candidatus Sedimenticola endophacoides]OQX34639.1 MAG: hypothetical protein B0D96_08850 [Candidatus Sedimenticola endophacoides]OQX36783.1 MAG: hypothetical protein B0D84_01200 [Candidatus Sedimenticola endophacoides]OQX41831.1 MAG: hypothetical protein B0D89_02920 [Candidatus Sedimenticola endophacoides]OQX42707.1 MAG: hypothetical protein B0D88_06160 [Candidatus Sedimenticola endophacoides]
MGFGLFRPRPLLDEPSVEWMFDVFSWALRNLDAEVFRRHTILVTPSNEHFPGRVESPEGMARLIFERVAHYAGMAHWPLRLTSQPGCYPGFNPGGHLPGPLRGTGLPSVDAPQPFPVVYDPHQARDPQVLIATLAHTLAERLGRAAPEAAPGGEENWPHVVELLAVFMGFGLMFANSAYVAPKGGCGSCGPGVQRHAFLSQYHLTYALAIFAELKGIPAGEVVVHLKRPLRGFFRKARKEIAGGTRLQALRALL